ncbi:MAG: hypothetical protein ACM3QY_07945 [Candidatus Levyibacteriota bacterium]
MESFIVRIYRAAGSDGDAASGTVERVGSGERNGFSGREQLVELLLGRPKRDDEAAPGARRRRPE